MKCSECGRETQRFMSTIHEDKNHRRRYGILCPWCSKKPHSQLHWWKGDPSPIMNDPRFRDWQPNDKSPKASILEHLDYAHEAQSRRDCYRWLSNFQYFYKKYPKKKLLEIHAKYHGE